MQLSQYLQYSPNILYFNPLIKSGLPRWTSYCQMNFKSPRCWSVFPPKIWLSRIKSCGPCRLMLPSITKSLYYFPRPFTVLVDKINLKTCFPSRPTIPQKNLELVLKYFEKYFEKYFTKIFRKLFEKYFENFSKLFESFLK